MKVNWNCKTKQGSPALVFNIVCVLETKREREREMGSNPLMERSVSTWIGKEMASRLSSVLAASSGLVLFTSNRKSSDCDTR